MKSIKEKAEAYDKVLEWATEAHKVCDGMLKEDLEHLFPELKESEDERMIQYFKDLAPFDKADELYEKYGFSHKDAIAWLEKQGGHAKFINGIQVGDKVTRNEDGVLVNLSQLKRVAKPADTEKGAKGNEKEIPNSVWSEEDEQYLLVCKNALAKYQITDKWDADIISRWLENNLKSFKERVQPKQEWSEEDDLMATAVENSFYLHCGQMTDRLSEQYKKFFEKVKSLRLQNTWKPSAEQIRRLEYFLKLWGKTEDIENTKVFETVKSLLNDLKKLRDE